MYNLSTCVIHSHVHLSPFYFGMYTQLTAFPMLISQGKPSQWCYSPHFRFTTTLALSPLSALLTWIFRFQTKSSSTLYTLISYCAVWIPYHCHLEKSSTPFLFPVNLLTLYLFHELFTLAIQNCRLVSDYSSFASNNLSEILIYPNITFRFYIQSGFAFYVWFITCCFTWILTEQQQKIYMEVCKCNWEHNFFLLVYFYEF